MPIHAYSKEDNFLTYLKHHVCVCVYESVYVSEGLCVYVLVRVLVYYYIIVFYVLLLLLSILRNCIFSIYIYIRII